MNHARRLEIACSSRAHRLPRSGAAADACGWIRTNERTNRWLLGPLPLSARRRTRLRPAGFEPANSPFPTTTLSEKCDGRIISPLRCQATLRARVWRRSLLRRGRVVVRPRLLGRPRIAPPGLAPGTPGSRPDGIAGFPTGLSSPRRDSNADPLAQDEVRLPLAPRG